MDNNPLGVATLEEPTRNHCAGTQHEPMRSWRLNHGNPGLNNSSVACYSNAVLQALASCNHLTKLFSTPPRQIHERFALYYAFSQLLYSIVNPQPSQQNLVDPSKFNNLFIERNKEFSETECEYYHVHASPPKIYHSTVSTCTHNELNNDFIKTYTLYTPNSGDAGEYIIRLRGSLISELEQENGYDSSLHDSMKEYWNIFNSGLEDQMITCTVCKKVSKHEVPFEELLLPFDIKHHGSNNKSDTCTLGELVRNYCYNQDEITDYECMNCNGRTVARKVNRVCRFPKVLIIVLNRIQWQDDSTIRVQTAVDFPVESFATSDIFQSHEGTVNETYNLVSTINHLPRGGENGHYTTISRMQGSDIWYEYDDEKVSVSNFIKTSKNGMRVAKVKHQREVTILFYERKQRPSAENNDSPKKVNDRKGDGRNSDRENTSMSLSLTAQSIPPTNDSNSIGVLDDGDVLNSVRSRIDQV